MRDREYECWCGSCHYHWYLRLRGDPTPIVRPLCPRCDDTGIANELLPMSLIELPSEPS